MPLDFSEHSTKLDSDRLSMQHSKLPPKIRLLAAFIGLLLMFSSVSLMPSLAIAANRVGEVVEEEVETIARRFRSREYSYFALGPFLLQNSENKSTSHHFAAGYVWDSTVLASVKTTAEVVASFKDPKTMLWNLGLGANYFISSAPTSPFVTADFGYGGSVTDSEVLENTVGFSLGGGVGLGLFRTSGTQLQILLRQLIVFEKNGSGYPGYIGLSLGLLY